MSKQINISVLDEEYVKKISEQNITTIIFEPQFNERIELEIIPPNIEKIFFGIKSSVKHDDMEEFSKYILNDTNSFSKFNNKSLNNLKNTFIKWIIFPYDSTYNYPIMTLPLSLEILTLGNNFSKSLENLPTSLKYFTLQTQNYIQSINFLSQFPNLIYFGLKTSNEIMLKQLPNQTIYFELDSSRKHPIVISTSEILDLLPQSIRVLKLDCYYKSSLLNLPKNLTELFISNLHTMQTLQNLPPGLKSLHIRIGKNLFVSEENYKSIFLSNLPSSLKRLSIETTFYGLNCSNLSNSMCSDTFAYLPETLEMLELKRVYISEHALYNLPSGLKVLNMMDCYTDNLFKSDLLNNLPRQLAYMGIFCDFTKLSEIKNIPPKLQVFATNKKHLSEDAFDAKNENLKIVFCDEEKNINELDKFKKIYEYNL